MNKVSNVVSQVSGGNVIKQGSENLFGFVFRDENGAVIDLQGSSVIVKIANRKIVVLEKTATVTSDNIVTFLLANSDVTGHGEMRIEFIVTYSDGTKQMFPADGWQKIIISPSLDNAEVGGISYVTVQSIQSDINSFKSEVTTTVEEVKTKSTIAENTANSVRTELDGVVNRATDSDAMSRQAAVDTNGMDKVNLKQRIDDDYNTVTSQLAENTKRLKNVWVDVKEDFEASGDGIVDDTQFIQATLNYANSNGIDTVRIPKGTFLIDAGNLSDGTSGGILIPSGITLLMDEETILKCKPNGSGNYNIIRIYEGKNISIVNGNIVGDRSGHTGTTGEWGHGVNIRGGENIQIKNVTVKDCWGDGIYIGKGSSLEKPSVNVSIENCLSDNNRRQGLSIVHVTNCLVFNSTFSNTNGTSPECGIDVEPNNGENVINLKIESCKFIGNNRAGLQLFSTYNWVERVVIKECEFKENKFHGIRFRFNVRKCEVISCKSFSNIGTGISFEDGSGENKITRSEFYSNTTFGIKTGNSHRNEFYGNKVYSNNSSNIELSSGVGNRLINNEVNSAGVDGIALYTCESTELYGNDVKNSAYEGIRLDGSIRTSLKGGNIFGNGKYGIRTKSSNEVHLEADLKDNGTTIDQAFAHVYVESGDDISIVNSYMRKGSGVNKVKYGIQVVNTATNIYIANNDMFNSAVTSSISDPGNVATKVNNRL